MTRRTRVAHVRLEIEDALLTVLAQEATRRRFDSSHDVMREVLADTFALKLRTERAFWQRVEAARRRDRRRTSRRS